MSQSKFKVAHYRGTEHNRYYRTSFRLELPLQFRVCGTISRRISHRGQFFPQFVRRQLEQLPEAQAGQLYAQQAVRRLILAASGPEPPQVPVQPLQVQ